ERINEMKVELQVSGDLTADVVRGGENHALELAKALADRGYEISLLSRSRCDEVTHTEVCGFPTTILPRIKPRKFFWRLGMYPQLGRLAQQIKDYGADSDIVINFSPWLTLASRMGRPNVPNFYVVADLLVAAKRFQEGKTFAFSGGNWLKFGLDAWLEKKAYLNACDMAFPQTHWMLEGLVTSGIPREKLQQGYVGACPTTCKGDRTRETVRDELNIPPAAAVVLYMGAMTRRKNPVLLARAMKNAPENLYAIFAGAGDCESEVRAACTEAGVDNRVRFTGWTQTPADYYRAADILCHTALYETAGMIFTEAMMHSLAVVAPQLDPPNVYGIGCEAIIDGQSGLLYDALDPQDLAAKLSQLATDAALLDSMKREIPKRLDVFSWTRYCDIIETEIKRFAK
ncbi:MAG: glycosyltransferase family 4 protein, partial [Phycisphaerae bacterium]|nr:glycosyltransferase family 4 protein [Phycisphaerae bacterium]